MSTQSNKIQLQIIEDLTEVVKTLVERERRIEREGRKPLLILTNNLNNINMNTTLTLGLNAISTLVLVDNKTLQPISVTFAGQTVTSDTPSVATFAFDPLVLTQVDATTLSVGSGNILLSAVATYTDSNTSQIVTQTFTATYPFTVTEAAEGLTLSLTDFVNVPSSTTSTSTTSTTTV